ncbi:MAG TPA: S4 domain-containing protein, partial [Novosphingobium sp.]|nr:S4 domain-containing protein [Novosphingobium sp.]
MPATPKPNSAIKPGKVRVDQLLVERGLAESRARAQALVLAGLVFSGETKLAQSRQTPPDNAPLDVRG